MQSLPSRQAASVSSQACGVRVLWLAAWQEGSRSGSRPRDRQVPRLVVRQLQLRHRQARRQHRRAATRNHVFGELQLATAYSSSSVPRRSAARFLTISCSRISRHTSVPTAARVQSEFCLPRALTFVWASTPWETPRWVPSGQDNTNRPEKQTRDAQGTTALAHGAPTEPTCADKPALPISTALVLPDNRRARLPD